eukprot:3800990-Amphidinium_carterae.1
MSSPSAVVAAAANVPSARAVVAKALARTVVACGTGARVVVASVCILILSSGHTHNIAVSYRSLLFSTSRNDEELKTQQKLSRVTIGRTALNAHNQHANNKLQRSATGIDEKRSHGTTLRISGALRPEPRA